MSKTLFSITTCLCIVLLAILTLRGHAIGINNAWSIDEIERSAQSFIVKFYYDLRKQDAAVVSNYFKDKNQKYLSNIIDGTKNFPIDKFEFLEMNILSKEPLTIEVVVKEIYTAPEYFSHLEKLFILQDTGGLNWTIIELTEPGLP